MYSLAQTSLWWPGLRSGIGSVCNAWVPCAKRWPNRDKPLVTSDLSLGLWKKLWVNLLKKDSNWYILSSRTFLVSTLAQSYRGWKPSLQATAFPRESLLTIDHKGRDLHHNGISKSLRVARIILASQQSSQSGSENIEKNIGRTVTFPHSNANLAQT
jgi:hypothetical protein